MKKIDGKIDGKRGWVYVYNVRETIVVSWEEIELDPQIRYLTGRGLVSKMCSHRERYYSYESLTKAQKAFRHLINQHLKSGCKVASRQKKDPRLNAEEVKGGSVLWGIMRRVILDKYLDGQKLENPIFITLEIGPALLTVLKTNPEVIRRFSETPELPQARISGSC
ncbi:MAG: hypothetical protein Q8R34_00265 [bacterium]|nr:hypothetical protein [bacterium]